MCTSCSRACSAQRIILLRQLSILNSLIQQATRATLHVREFLEHQKLAEQFLKLYSNPNVRLMEQLTLPRNTIGWMAHRILYKFGLVMMDLVYTLQIATLGVKFIQEVVKSDGIQVRVVTLVVRSVYARSLRHLSTLNSLIQQATRATLRVRELLEHQKLAE